MAHYDFYRRVTMVRRFTIVAVPCIVVSSGLSVVCATLRFPLLNHLMLALDAVLGGILISLSYWILRNKKTDRNYVRAVSLVAVVFLVFLELKGINDFITNAVILFFPVQMLFSLLLLKKTAEAVSWNEGFAKLGKVILGVAVFCAAFVLLNQLSMILFGITALGILDLAERLGLTQIGGRLTMNITILLNKLFNWLTYAALFVCIVWWDLRKNPLREPG